MAKGKKNSLGKGLDSLIPDLYNEESGSVSLEELLDEDESLKTEKKVETKKTEKKTASKKTNDTKKETKKTKAVEKDENIDEVLEIVKKNPRITLWSARSAAVFRYLRKTEPEFSISNEASNLIDEAVKNKYPDIWKLFEI